MKILTLLFMLLFMFGAFADEAVDPYPFDDMQHAEQFYHLTNELRCVVCQNQTILDSDAPLAKDLRDEVYQMVLKNESNDAIIDFLVRRYGDFILYKPPLQANTALLWFGPLILLLIAAVALIVIVRAAHRRARSRVL